jgi:hypothetical protein
MDETTPAGPRPTEGWAIPRWLYPVLVLLAGVGIYYAFFGPPERNVRDIDYAPPPMPTTRAIALAMSAYARDNGGRYPDGHTSTEVFQKLLDGNYISDPVVFYLDMRGKVKADSKELSADNVAYDVTIPVDGSTSGDVPVVFDTGYRIEYKPGGSATPLPGRARPDSCRDGLSVCCHDNNAFVKPITLIDGTVANFIPATSHLGPGPFTQLTPEGPLSPAAP